MTHPTILVTAATGHTGFPAVRYLRERGYPVRAFVRRQDARSEALKALGAEIFVGDLFNMEDLRRALAGVSRAYYCPPFADSVLHGTTLFAIAAQEAKLEVVALLSQWNPHPTHPSFVSRQHWIANEIMRWMPSVDVVHISPGLFPFVYFLGLPAMAHFGMMLAPFGKGENAPPAHEDIARVVASVLADPREHVGKSYRPTGPQLLSPQEIAGHIGKALGRKVTYSDISFRTFTKAAVALGFPASELSQLRFYLEDLREGAHAAGAPTDHVRQVTGVEPEPFDRMAKRYIANPDLIYHGLRAGTFGGAMRFFMRMIATRPPNLDAWEDARGYPRLAHPQSSMKNDAWIEAASAQRLFLLPDTPSLNSDTRRIP